MLFATHYLEEADQYADRIILISNGRIVADGTGSEIKALAAGRTVRATLRGADTAALSAIGGVDSVEVRGDQVYVHAKDSDAVARYLLTQTDARDLEIIARGLEDAFLSLTGRRRRRTGRRPRRMSTAAHPDRPDRPARPAVRRLQRDRAADRAQADAAQPTHDHLHADLPGRDVLRRSAGTSGAEDRVGSGNVSAYIMVSMALYGAALIAAAGGAMVAARAFARLVPPAAADPAEPGRLHPDQGVRRPRHGCDRDHRRQRRRRSSRASRRCRSDVWIACALVTLACTLTFAALGVFVGYVVPGENAMQILGPGLALLSFLGGVFIPLTDGLRGLRTSPTGRRCTASPRWPASPLTHELPWYAVVNAVAWFLVFVAGAAWRMSKDTARV